jgi:predicted metalloprotease
MEWEDGDRSGDVEDRRGMHPAVLGGGVGVGGLIIAAIGYFVFGANPSDTLQAVSAINGARGPASQVEGQRGTPKDQAGAFVDVIETSTTEVWSKLIDGYKPPTAVVLYDEETPTSCGAGQAAMGPFYCPNDHKVYLDLSFWNELSDRFGAKGEFARAYVIAHEIGHNVQNQTGQLDRSEKLGSRGASSGSVRAELQADCYAGVWAAHAGEASGGKIVINADDIASGMAAASAVGDDKLQAQTGGRVVPDTFTHGSSAQRMRWFQRGYSGGDPNNCDTFSAASL